MGTENKREDKEHEYDRLNKSAETRKAKKAEEIVENPNIRVTEGLVKLLHYQM